ncbi:MAG TPA: ribosome silencing factor [Bryobacteraceae bacterium]|nr:ribosome silencing factor [Bryobacteraceae bacterium]
MPATQHPPIADTPEWLTAVRAAESKKAQDIKVLDLRDLTSFADYFIILTGTNTRQNQAISDEIYLQMKEAYGSIPVSYEGYTNAEWILMDYGSVLVHIFLDRARSYYDLERLWRGAKDVSIPPEDRPTV